MKHLIAIGLLVAAAFAAANSDIPLISLDSYSTGILPCCMNPANAGDTRCSTARFFYAPGTEAGHPGTYGPDYSPWQGDCNGNGS